MLHDFQVCAVLHLPPPTTKFIKKKNNSLKKKNLPTNKSNITAPLPFTFF